MGRAVEFTLRELENDALVVFIDLLGNKKQHESIK